MYQSQSFSSSVFIHSYLCVCDAICMCVSYMYRFGDSVAVSGSVPLRECVCVRLPIYLRLHVFMRLRYVDKIIIRHTGEHVNVLIEVAAAGLLWCMSTRKYVLGCT